MTPQGSDERPRGWVEIRSLSFPSPSWRLRRFCLHAEADFAVFYMPNEDRMSLQ